MTEISCYYAGDLKCDSIHISSGEKIRTDAPVDHYGKGDNFSPTDLLATSVGTCLLTIMAIKARNNGWEIEDINLKIKKNMTENSNRKIKELIANYEVEMQKNITARWEADLKSDSWLSKNVRPMVLIFLIVCTMLLIFIDAGAIKFNVKDSYIDLLQLVLITVIGAYFGGRSLEKVKK